MSGPRRPGPPDPDPRSQRPAAWSPWARPQPVSGNTGPPPRPPDPAEQQTVPLSDRARRRLGPVDPNERTLESERPHRSWPFRTPWHQERHAPRHPAPQPPPGYRPVGYRQPDPAPAHRHTVPTRWLLLGGGLAALALVFAILLGMDTFGAPELDVDAAQAGVQQVLTDPINGYGRTDVSDVRCNNGENPVARQGSGFSCQVRVGGVQRQVAVIFTDDRGTYEVDRPR